MRPPTHLSVESKADARFARLAAVALQLVAAKSRQGDGGSRVG